MQPLLASTKALDKRWADEYQMPLLLMMDAAGQAIAQAIVNLNLSDSSLILLLAGSGNNGGDAYAAAHHLRALNFSCLQLLQVAPPRSQEAQSHARMARAYGVECLTLDDDWRHALSQAVVVVDGLLGRGLNRPVEGSMADVIQAVNARRRRWPSVQVIAIDLPSGLNATTGQVMGQAIQAHATVALSVPAPGLYLSPGKTAAGRILVSPIGCPPALLRPATADAHLLELPDIASSLPARDTFGHKYQAGQVLVVASSPQYPGAGQLVCRAAFAAGAGMVRWAVSPELLHPWPVVEAVPFLLNQAEEPEPEHQFQALSTLLESGKIQALAYGPGLGTDESALSLSQQLLPWLINQPELTVVLDADGLTHLSRLELQSLAPQFILTPHTGELKQLAPDLAKLDPLTAARRLSERFNCHVLLKSPGLIYASPDGATSVISPFGNNGMATGGTGDVLTGILAGLAAQQPDRRAVCLAGMGLHGLAGDLAAQALTPYSLTAGHLVDYLPQALKQCLQQG